MIARFALPVILGLASLANAQTNQPPDQKAYAEASKITDPEKKIEALQKFKTDFPDSAMVRLVDQSILTTLVNKLPQQAERIRKFAAGMFHNAAGKDRGATAQQIAAALLNANLLLADARSYSRTAVDSMSLAAYIQEQSETYRQRKQAPPWTRDLEKRFADSRAARVATLGRIELKLGHSGKARRLLEEAYAVNPTTPVQSGLGELAAKAGNDAKALEYLVPAKLSGTAPKEANDALAAIYRKQHGDSLAGFDAMLDTEYHKRYPNPVKTETYTPAAHRTDRLVLAEVFTGAGCGPCVAADLAFDAAMSRYSRKDLAVVMYHEHVPRPDPMTNPDTEARSKSFSVQGVPTFAIDGKKTIGGGSREMTRQAYDRFNPDIEKDLESPAEARVKAEAALTGNTVHVKAAVDGVKGGAKNLKVQILLLEKEIRYTGENGVRFHPMVVRAIGGKDGAGFPLDGAAAVVAGSFEQSFDIDAVSQALKAHLDKYEADGHRGETFTFIEKKYQIDKSDLAVVVFVQDDQTKHVLQSAYIDLGRPAGGRTITEANEAR